MIGTGFTMIFAGVLSDTCFRGRRFLTLLAINSSMGVLFCYRVFLPAFIVGHLGSIFLSSYSFEPFEYLVPFLAGAVTWGTNFFYFILATSYLVHPNASAREV